MSTDLDPERLTNQRRPTGPLLALALLVIAPLAPAGTIKGRVVDPNGQGVQGVDIDVETPAGGDVDIDSDGTSATGHFVTTVPDGLFTVLFNPPAALESQLLTSVLEGVSVSGTVDLGVIELRAGVALSGRVLDDGGQPVAGVDLDVVELATDADLVIPGDTTGADGRFAITVLTTAVEVQFETAHLAGPSLAPTSVEVSTSVALDLGDIVLQDGFTLSGSVVDPDLQPVPFADLDVFLPGGGAKLFTPGDDTDGAGAFQLIVPAGSYDLRVDPPFGAGVLTGWFEDVLVAGDTDVGALVLTAGELGVPLDLGDRFEGVLDPADVDAVEFDATAGTKLSLTLKAAKGSTLQPSFRLLGPDDAVLVEAAESIASAKLAKAKKLVAPLTGRYRVELEAAGATSGGYRLTTKGKPPRSFKADLSVPDQAELVFGALEGWTLKKAKVKAKTGKTVPEPLQPALTLEDPDGTPVPLDDLLSANAKGTQLTLGALVLESDGDHVLRVGGEGGSSGPARLTVVLSIPKTKPATVLEPE